jgi:hypothetical protein
MNWQLVITAFIVLAAAFFVVRRILQRLRAFRNASFQSSCSGCVGVCSPHNDVPAKTNATLIQLTAQPRQSHKASVAGTRTDFTH